MKRMVVDKNMLEDPKNLGRKQPLRAWLAESKDHIAVVTDYAQLEIVPDPDPEIVSVGLSPDEAKRAGHELKIASSPSPPMAAP
jgi:pyruvate/2-oxoglutarate dehydrogenase complex dihydrolipoamide dehydrogenase (E3) component